MGGFSFAYRRYLRRFRKPMRTAWGEWHERAGIVIRLESAEGRVGFGEVAPRPWEGETELTAAAAFFASLGGKWNPEVGKGAQMPPDCRLALESARDQAHGRARKQEFAVAALLPAGEAALEVFRKRWSEGFRVFKWKIGVEGFSHEKAILQQLLNLEDGTARFRLDGNGGFSVDEAVQWLKILPPERIAFFEQPLPSAQETAMRHLGEVYGIPLALDESVNDWADWKQTAHHWPGVFVIKPSWLGAWDEPISELPPWSSQLVFSSAFETSIGVENALRFAKQVGGKEFALGFGCGDWLEDDGLYIHENGPGISTGKLGIEDLEAVWNRIPAGNL